MRLALKQFCAIAILTAVESLRQPITLLLTAGTVAFIGLLPILVTHTLGEGQRLVRDSALSLQLVSGLVLGVLTASATVSREIRHGTAPAILSKPVDRGLFLTAKFAGAAIPTLLFSAHTLGAALLGMRTAATDFTPDWWGIGPLFAGILLAFIVAGVHHYFAGGPFSSRACAYLTLATALAVAVSHIQNPGALAWNLAPASALIALCVLVMTALAVSLSTRLDMIPVLSLCAAILMLGLISDHLVGQLPDSARALRFAIECLPNGQNFWLVDALNRDGVPMSYLVQAARYAAFYLAGILCAGIFAFRRMEVR